MAFQQNLWVIESIFLRECIAALDEVAPYAVNPFCLLGSNSCCACWICCLLALIIFGGPGGDSCFFRG